MGLKKLVYFCFAHFLAFSPLPAVSRAGPMDSVYSFSFWVVGVGVMVMLAGQELGFAVFCVLKISSTIKIKLNKNQKKTLK